MFYSCLRRSYENNHGKVLMRIFGTGDFHARDTQPRNRVDPYMPTLLWKFHHVMEKTLPGDVVILPGDITDAHKVSDELKTLLIEEFSKYRDRHLLVVYGQHDQQNRDRNLRDTAFGVLTASKVVTVLSERPLEIGNCLFYGSSYNQGIPRLLRKSDKYRVLVTHKMLSDKDYWFGKVKYSSADAFLDRHKFDLIVSGDNHHAFTTSLEGRSLVNCGSWMRSKTDQATHRPMFVVWQDGKLEKHFIPIEEIVLKLEEKKEKPKNRNLEVFIRTLKDVKNPELDFISDLEKDLKEVEPVEGEEEILWEAVNKKRK